MWTRKSTILLCISILLIVLGLIFRSILYIATSIIFISFIIVSMFSNRIGDLKITRKLTTEKVFEDGTIGVEVSITNEGSRTGFLELMDTVPNRLKIKKGTNYTMVDLKKGESAKLHYMIQGVVKGIYTLGPVKLRSHDVFDLFLEEAELKFYDNLTIFPRVETLKSLEIKSKAPKMYPGASPVKQPGSGTDFFLIREYVPGDAFKNINWKAYARSGDLLVNEKERESVSDITIVVDARKITKLGTEGENPHIYACRAAATLANLFLKRRDSVGLVIYSDKLFNLKPGQGQKQLYEILTALASVEPAGNLPLTGVAEVALPFMPRKSPIILISTLDNDDSIRKAASDIRVLDFDLTVISPSSIEFESAAMKRKGIVDEIAFDVLRLERQILIDDLRGIGSKVVDWPPQMPTAEALSQVEVMR